MIGGGNADQNWSAGGVDFDNRSTNVRVTFAQLWSTSATLICLKTSIEQGITVCRIHFYELIFNQLRSRLEHHQ